MQINVCWNDNCVPIYMYMRLNTQLAKMETMEIWEIFPKYRNLWSGLQSCILWELCRDALQIPYRSGIGL